MIENVKNAILQSLNAEFGDDVKLYTENVKQGFDKPCFFIKCITSNRSKRIFSSYEQVNSFVISYFSKNNKKADIENVFRRLYFILEIVKDGEYIIRGHNMNTEIVDGVGHFMVDYVLCEKVQSESIKMKKLNIESEVNDG